MKTILLSAIVTSGLMAVGITSGVGLGAAQADAPSSAPRVALHALAAKLNAAAEISFAAAYMSVGNDGKPVLYNLTGILAKPNVGEISVTAPSSNGATDTQDALLYSNGTDYTVVAPGKSQYVTAAVTKKGIDSDSTEASYFLYDVVGHPGIVAQNIADALVPADFDIGDETMPAGIKRVLTYTISTTQIDGRACTDVTQKLVGARHTALYDTIIDSSTGALVEIVSYTDDTGIPKLDEKIAFSNMQLLPKRQAGIAFAYTPSTGMQVYHAAAGPGTVASNFAVQRSDGSAVHLSDYKGKVVVIDFWATWCPPCLKTLPSTDKLAAKYQPQGVVFLPICTWDTKTRFESWVPMHSTWAMTWLFDPAADNDSKSIASTEYAISGIPAQYVIGKDGKVVYRAFADSDAGERPLVQAIDKAMSAS